MNILSKLALMLVGVSALGTPEAVAQVQSDLYEEGRACEQAFEKRTVQALKDFLLKSPGNTVCRALTFTALGDDREHGGGPPTSD